MPSTKWQRCIFHLAQNVGHHSPSKVLQAEIHTAVKEIYTAQDRAEAESRMKKVFLKLEDKAPKFCAWLEENFGEGLMFFDFPKGHWKQIRTVNGLERINREQKRRTRTVGVFPSVESCERLVVSLAIRIHEEWETERKYLKDE